jgi:hypothetical protein
MKTSHEPKRGGPSVHEPKRGGLSVKIKMGGSVLLFFEDKQVKITLYETSRTRADLTIQADKTIRIQRVRATDAAVLDVTDSDSV